MVSNSVMLDLIDVIVDIKRLVSQSMWLTLYEVIVDI